MTYSVSAVAYQPTLLSPLDPAVFTVIQYADDLAVPLNLGANAFNLFGATYQGSSSLFCSSNGLITFGTGDADFTNADLTNSPFQAAIAPLWTDWYKFSGGPMLLGKFDTTNSDLILQWDQVLDNNSTTASPVTFQAVLQLNTGTTPGTITFNYVHVSTNSTTSNGADATVGIKDAGAQGSNRNLVSFNHTNPLIGDGLALQLSWNQPVQPPSLVSVTPGSAIEGGGVTTVGLTGSNFVSNTLAQVNGVNEPTTVIDPNHLQVVIPAQNLADEGTLTLTAFNPGSGLQSTNSLPFSVMDAPLSASGVGVAAVEGNVFSGTVATFTDGNTAGSATDFSASIAWGDGQTSGGTITATGPGQYAISGTHSYAEEASFPVSVQIGDLGGSTASATSTATVADAALSVAVASVNAFEGNVATRTIASFSDADSSAPASDFQATIQWGDGQSSPGSIVNTGPGTFSLTASHIYVEEGSYSVQVQINDVGSATASGTGTATVADAPLSANIVPFQATEGSPFSGVVARFTDANPQASAADFQATIVWGDGHKSAGTIASDGQGGFTVSSSNTYADEGNYNFSVQISDYGGASANAAASITVADAPLALTPLNIQPTAQSLFTGSVAQFTDANPNAALSDFSATIEWGDGTTSIGAITADPNGGFTVAGSHTYAALGSYTMTIMVADDGSSIASVSETVQVTDSIPQASARLLRGHLIGNWAFVLGSYSDLIAEHHTARIDWGDGTVSTLDLGVASQGWFFRAHRYSRRFLRQHEHGFNIQVAVADDAGATSTPVLLSVDPRHHRHHDWANDD